MPVSQSFGVGMGPILLDNVICDQNHSELFQCVHPQLIGIHDCDRENVAGVICPGPAITTITDMPHSTTLFLTTLISTNTQNIDSEMNTTSSMLMK